MNYNTSLEEWKVIDNYLYTGVNDQYIYKIIEQEIEQEEKNMKKEIEKENEKEKKSK